jgi:hypothetical protein
VLDLYWTDRSSKQFMTTCSLFPDFKFYTVRIGKLRMTLFWRGWVGLVPTRVGAWFRRAGWKLEYLWREKLNGPHRLYRLGLHLTGRYSPFYVNVYDVDQQYGGGEEGGWWYQVGEPSQYFSQASFPVETEEEGQRLRDALRAKIRYPDGHHDQYSMLSDGDVEVTVEDDPARSYPQSRPYYSSR